MRALLFSLPAEHRIQVQGKTWTAPPSATVIRCLRPDGDIHYLRHAPDPAAKPLVLLHCPVF